MNSPRQFDGTYSVCRSMSASVLACLAVTILLAACASTNVSNVQSSTSGPIPRPANIWIYPFAGSPADVPPGTDFSTLSTAQGPPPTAQDIATGRQLGAQLSTTLVADLQGKGLPARFANPATRPLLNDLVIQGCLYSIVEGSAGKRMILGFGSGASDLSTAVEVFQMTSAGLTKLGSGDVQSGSNKTPGMALGAATYAVTNNPAGLIISGGMKIYGQASGKDTIEGRVEATAKEIADQLYTRFQARGWAN
jgi:Domain of unknown function (DUF4410)